MALRSRRSRWLRAVTSGRRACTTSEPFAGKPRASAPRRSPTPRNRGPPIRPPASPDQLALFAPPALGDPERWARARGLRIVAGIDEVGRGPLAGPVVAACVVLPPNSTVEGVNDSKVLSPGRRETLAVAIRQTALAWAVAEVDAGRIDEINILEATREAMLECLSRVRRDVTIDVVLVDGNQGLPIDLPQRALVSGDSLSENIAAASIIAKVHRDQIMRRYHLLYPAYGFDRHKGYGSADHLEALRRHGPCPIHRRSFRGVLGR